jgi:hypothetical protein
MTNPSSIDEIFYIKVFSFLWVLSFRQALNFESGQATPAGTGE